MALTQKLAAGVDLARAHAAALPYRRRRRTWRFTLDGTDYPYLTHHFNQTWRNERAVELPVAMALLDERRGRRTLEIGHVSHWYRSHSHEVVDKYEVAPGVTNLDVVDIPAGGRYETIVAISTLEHVGFDEEHKDPGKPRAAVEHLRSLLVRSGRMLVTIPLGQNPGADDLFYGKPIFDAAAVLHRVSEDGVWKQTTFEHVEGVRYGEPYECANAVAFGWINGNP